MRKWVYCLLSDDGQDEAETKGRRGREGGREGGSEGRRDLHLPSFSLARREGQCGRVREAGRRLRSRYLHDRRWTLPGLDQSGLRLQAMHE